MRPASTSASILAACLALALGLLTAEIARAGDARDLIAEYLHRYHELADGDVPGRLDLAEWCKTRRMSQQQAELLTEVLKLQPDHATAYRDLLPADAQRFRPVEPDWARRIQALLDGRFHLKHSAHFTLLTDASDDSADTMLESLEAAYATFYSQVPAIGLRPMPPAGRLVVVFFGKFEEYRDYLHRYEGVGAAWVGGYYSWRTNRAAFFHDLDNPAFTEVRKRIGQADQTIAELRQRMTELGQSQTAARITAQDELKRLNAERTDLAQQLASISRILTLSKTRHEATHQLLFNSGIQRRGQEYPFWLSEGLAMLFESTDAEQRVGPTVVNRYRLSTYRKAVQDNAIVSLPDLLAVRLTADANASEASAHYAQAWVLAHFLWNKRPEQLRQLLNDLNQDGGRDNGLPLFKKHFAGGADDLGPLEADVRRFADSLQ